MTMRHAWKCIPVACAIGALGAHAGAQISVDAEIFASGLSQPVGLVSDGISNRLFALEQEGLIRVIDASGNLLPLPFLSITAQTLHDSERGLLGMAFHPNFSSNGYFYVNFTSNSNDTAIARYSVSPDNPNVADPDSQQPVLVVTQPAGNNNGGWMAFGPDGYLYIGMGDGGAGGDPWGTVGNGQDLSTLLGAMLRIDVDGGSLPGPPDANYTIPPDNPFVDGDPNTRDEIWAYGLRNPWRNDFDPATGDLYITDIGRASREEINFQPPSSPGGENYGWRKWEGTLLNMPGDPAPDAADAVFPVAEYQHAQVTNSWIVGGVVCRTQTLPDLWGAFVYGDRFGTIPVSALRKTASGWAIEELALNTSSQVSGFARGTDGRVYMWSESTGRVYRLTQPGRCGLGDIDDNGVLNLDDITALATAFLASDPDGDLDRNGIWNLDNITLFATSFLAGCP